MFLRFPIVPSQPGQGWLARLAQRQLTNSPAQCAGHNKWSKIKQKKGANDASKSAAFQRATQDILVAARSGGVDPDKNSVLAAVIKRLKAQDVPKDNITKALSKAAKVKNSGDISTYEAIACNSVGIIIECATDNANRTVQTLREILNSQNARMASVGYMFTRGGVVVVQIENGLDADERLDTLAEMALCEGAEDFEVLSSEGDSQPRLKFYCDPSALSELTSKLTKQSGVTVLESQLDHYPVDKTTLSDEDADVLEQLISALEGRDDVVRVTTSADIP
ncbi:DUF28-domain-containing protein [Lentinula aciculospora]|uniref:DUF28-domain-containing protein n=1 Tax=Lentinula aciculospora TaxID=153920 RepID=A0A9W9AT61_9AGAR|nr:DUF28-domain-containing protein [Lentinula aciculospora]